MEYEEEERRGENHYKPRDAKIQEGSLDVSLESAFETLLGPFGPSSDVPTQKPTQAHRRSQGLSTAFTLSHVRIIAWSFLPQHLHRLHMDNIMSTSSINLRNQPGELEKVELQQVQTRLLSAMFRRHDITQRECGWDDTAMT